MLLAYNMTAAPLALAGGSPIRTLPTSGSPGVRGPAFNVTSELRARPDAEYIALELQRSTGDVEFEWTADPEYSTGVLVADGPDPGLHASTHVPSGSDPLATASAGTITGVAAEGVAASLARSDHDHNYGAGSIANAALVNSTVALTAGAGVGVTGSPVALGGSATVNAQTVVTAVKVALYTAAVGETVRYDTTAGAFAINLPAVGAGNAGQVIELKNDGVSLNALTVTPSGADTIDHGLTLVLSAARASVYLRSDGVSNWMVC